jgi:hypothetical protein
VIGVTELTGNKHAYWMYLVHSRLAALPFGAEHGFRRRDDIAPELKRFVL